MKEALFLNGVFQGVLEEIMNSQGTNTEFVSYLQPYSSRPIKQLAIKLPSKKKPIALYISTTKNLGNVCYIADIIGWENKQNISHKRIESLNKHIREFQPNEREVYLKTENGKDCVNLLSIVNLRRMTNQISVKNLTKRIDNSPLKPRNQAGNWVYVYKLPSWMEIQETIINDNLEENFEKDVITSRNYSDEERKKRLLEAEKNPKQIQVISHAYQRNADVIVEVLNRANGKCEKCNSDAPFFRAKDNTPYLEIHHWKPLARGGEDTIDNAGALCPNCHRELHFGKNKKLQIMR